MLASRDPDEVAASCARALAFTEPTAVPSAPVLTAIPSPAEPAALPSPAARP
jgi:hypothetical protein